jgi:hypothetical protein
MHRVFSIGPIDTSDVPAFMVVCVDPNAAVKARVKRSARLGLQAWVESVAASTLAM